MKNIIAVDNLWHFFWLLSENQLSKGVLSSPSYLRDPILMNGNGGD